MDVWSNVYYPFFEEHDEFCYDLVCEWALCGFLCEVVCGHHDHMCDKVYGPWFGYYLGGSVQDGPF